MDKKTSEYFKDFVLFQIFGKEFRERLNAGLVPFSTVTVLYNEEIVDILIFENGWPSCSATIHMHDTGSTWFTLSWEVEKDG